MAAFDVGSIEASLTLDRNPFQRGLREARAEAKAFERDGITLDVDAATAGAKARLREIALMADRLSAKDVNIDVDVRRGFFERLAAVGASAGRLLANGLQEAFGAGGRLLTGFASALAGLPGLITGAAVVIAVVLLPALAALAASLAAATAGLGLLGLGFAAAFGPALLVGIALFSRLRAVMEARKAKEQELAQAVSQEKQAEEQRRAALEASRDAHRRLAETYVTAQRAMIQSAIELRDAELGLASSRLGVKEQRLAILEARQQLREFLKDAGASGHQLQALMRQFSDVEFNPAAARKLFAQTTGRGAKDPLELQRLILALQRSQLSYREAVNQVAHSEDRLTEAQRQRQDFLRRGVRAYAPYRAALRQVAQTEARLARVSEQASRAHDDYRRKLAALSATEQGTLGRLSQIIDGFGRFAKVLTDPIFRAFNEVFDRLHGRFSTLREPLRQVGEAMGDIVRSFGQFLGERETVGFMREAARTAASLAHSLGARAFTDFLRIMRNLAQAVFPDVRRIGGRVADVMHRLFLSTTNASRLRNQVRRLVGHLVDWLSLAKQLGRVFINFITDASGKGRHLTRTIRDWLKRLADFLATKRGRAEVLRWIRNSVSAAGDLGRALKHVVDAINAIYNAYQRAKDVFNALGRGGPFGVDANDFVKQAAADRNIIVKEVENLHKHLTRVQRQAARERLREALEDLKSIPEVSFPKSLQNLLDRVTRAATSSVAAPRPRAGASAVAAAGAGVGEVHFHAHGIDNPDQFISKAARKLASHPRFRSEGRREVQRRGRARR